MVLPFSALRPSLTTHSNQPRYNTIHSILFHLHTNISILLSFILSLPPSSHTFFLSRRHLLSLPFAVAMAFKEGTRDHLVALLLLCFSILIATTFSLSDADYLLQFKSNVADPKNVLSNWVPKKPPCVGNRSEWTGVFCDAGGNVVKIVLENMNLAGVLNTDPLVGLKALRSISFMNNEFEGPIPNVGQFVWLRSLYLSGNQLSGPIPDGEFTKMLAMNRVHLARNLFVGTIPTSLVVVKRLAELMLDGNQFDGFIPEFRQLGLKANFSNNALEGPIPVGLSKLDPSAFIGNKNLCGPPLNNPCIATSSSPPINSPKSRNILIPFKPFIITSILIALAVLTLFLLIIYRRHRRNQEECLGRPLSIRKNRNSFSASRMEGPSPTHVTCTDSICKRVVRESDHGRLVFVGEARGRFDLQDLLKASAEVLGSGSFGSSYKAVLPNGSAVVVKRFKEMNAVGRADFSEHMRRLGRLSHPNLVSLVAYYYRKEEKLLVFDYVPNGSLAHILHGNHGGNGPRLDWPARLRIVKGVARAMAYLHNELPILNLPHGNLKSSNVLLTRNFEPVLSDHGLTPVTNKAHAARVMVGYKAPEVVQYGNITKKNDVWCLGILILELLTAKFPASYLMQGNEGTDMNSWVNSIFEAVANKESTTVFDRQMGGGFGPYDESEMMKLLQIGRGCCEVDLGKRLDLIVAVEKIEELKEGDLVEEYSSCVSETMAQEAG